MALLTAGTAATTSLSALLWNPAGMSATDLGDLLNDILQYNVNGTPILPHALENGILTLPNGRGRVKVMPGDYLMVDGAGYPVVIPGSIFATSWVHS